MLGGASTSALRSIFVLQTLIKWIQKRILSLIMNPNTTQQLAFQHAALGDSEINLFNKPPTLDCALGHTLIYRKQLFLKEKLIYG